MNRTDLKPEPETQDDAYWFNQHPDDQQDDNKAPAEPLQPRCWRCFQPLNLCRCVGGPQ